MSTSFRTRVNIGGATVALLIWLPIAGVVASGKLTATYLQFPPRTAYVAHAPFSWTVFAVITFAIAVICLPFVIALLRREKRDRTISSRFPFPWWGWVGTGITAVSWLLAWTRLPWFDTLQPYTFFPLWFGYILIVNALTVVRTGRCLMLGSPGFFIALFPLSAAFWWCFEYLNRFVQNWYYLGIEGIGPTLYFLNATLAFSTVLPAVISTAAFLYSFPNRFQSLARFNPIDIGNSTRGGWVVLILAAGGLMGIGIWPDYLFPLLWVAPLLIITSLQAITGQETILTPVGRGDWRAVVVFALAALVCGFFWEMWNVYSLAHWEYAVPFVQRFTVFEMPVLGYAGYLPFGLECMVVAGLVWRHGGPSSIIVQPNSA